MTEKRHHTVAAAAGGAVAAVAVALAAWLWVRGPGAAGPASPDAPAVAASAPAQPDARYAAVPELAERILTAHRRVIVLVEGDSALTAAERERANQIGLMLFHDSLAKTDELAALLSGGAAADAARLAAIATLLDYVESDPGLFDADRLAFRELLRKLQEPLARDGSLPAIKLHRRIADDLEALAEIERNYEKELRQVFGRFGSRAIELKRERWDDYVARLRTLHDRDRILKDFGFVVPYVAKGLKPQAEEDGEWFGRSLPPKTIVLTFDDGPHGTYTPEIAAILRQFGAPAVFFQVGSNLGSVAPDGTPRLSRRAEVSRQLLAEGHALANHSLTHAQLSRLGGDALKAEILGTDELLKAVDKRRSPLFRFPYGARNAEGLQMLGAAHLRSTMWNIDSLDWADPVPASIAQRVLRTVAREGRGIVLFHDIHERTVKALPAVLSQLVAEGYQFAGWDGTGFSVPRAAGAATAPVLTAGHYGKSWAIVVGIDDYARWPKLQYAVRDARAVRDVLVQKFGFAPENVVTLENGQATRARILAAFHDTLSHGGMQRNDRLFVFFAGHGATRQLSSGRELGYVIPVESDPNQFASDAIPMSDLQNIAESVAAKHVFFVMDACYSGLGLTRGAAGNRFLRDNARRLGRQMLTAGGADQLVADGGPNGHSIFTWTLLQGLAGRGDLNGDGILTATELAAYVAPAVAAVSRQTPAFGSLPGSEGGDFVFELPVETEFLNAGSSQLPSDVIAMNSRLDAARPPAPSASAAAQAMAEAAPVIVRDLQGRDQRIVVPQAAATSLRQQAQRANDRGLQLYREKQYEQAEAQFTEALRLRPDFALAANNLGFIYHRQQRYPEAARWFANAIAMDPSRAVAYLNLGDAHWAAGDKDKAVKAYGTYLELAPKGADLTQVRQRVGQRS